MMIFQETETMELKKSTSELKEAVISLVAMLNKHQRGEIIFGIRNDGTVVGQQVSDKTIRDVSKAIADHIEPKVYPVVEQVSIDAKQCIKVQVEGSEHPYYAYGRAYTARLKPEHFIAHQFGRQNAPEFAKFFDDIRQPISLWNMTRWYQNITRWCLQEAWKINTSPNSVTGSSLC